MDERSALIDVDFNVSFSLFSYIVFHFIVLHLQIHAVL